MESDEVDLDLLFVSFLARDPEAIKDFPRLAAPRLKRLARKLGHGLPADIREETVQEMYSGLMRSDGRRKFDPQRGSIWKFLLGELLNAAQRVRANYCPVGVRTRKSKVDADEDVRLPESFDENLHRQSSAEELAPEFRRVEANLDLAVVLAGVPQLLIGALIGIHQEEEKVQEVARRLGVSRFWIAREANSLCARWRNSGARLSFRLNRRL
jgi:DNA-directed RNA polymerase specialized sigma24 family protein